MGWGGLGCAAAQPAGRPYPVGPPVQVVPGAMKRPRAGGLLIFVVLESWNATQE